jgi:hypothetical protein
MSETSAQDVARRGTGVGHPWKIDIAKSPHGSVWQLTLLDLKQIEQAKL